MNNVLESCVKAMDNDLQNEINLDQTDAYYEMINTIASKALQIRENLNKQQKYSLDDIYSELVKLTKDDLGIPSEDECMKMFRLLDSGLVWNRWVEVLDDIPTYKDKIWKIWREHFLSYMSVLMNF